jgi:hypothetical protein
MRVYKVKRGVVIEKDKALFLIENQNWDSFINDDNLFEKINNVIKASKPSSESRDTLLKDLMAPVEVIFTHASMKPNALSYFSKLLPTVSYLPAVK